MKIVCKKIIELEEKTPVYDLSMSKENPCFALDAGIISHNTLRWTAGIHTVPASCELKEIYEARRSDSMFLHLDYCLSKDTQILMGDGKTSKTVLQLLEDKKNGVENYLLSKNISTRKLTKNKLLDIYPVKIEQKLLELDFGKLIVKCTPDHKFYLTDGTIKCAKDIDLNYDEIDEAQFRTKCPYCDKYFLSSTKDHFKKEHPDVPYESFRSEISEYRNIIKKQGKTHSEATKVKMSKSRGNYYKNNPKVYFRSSYERQFYKNLDNDPNVESFLVEGFRIVYFDLEGNRRTTIPDVLVKFIDNPVQTLYEIKPLWKLREYLKSLKYVATMAHCLQMNWNFKVITEEEIFKDEITV